MFKCQLWLVSVKIHTYVGEEKKEQNIINYNNKISKNNEFRKINLTYIFTII